MEEDGGVDVWVREAMKNDEISAGVLLALKRSTWTRIPQPKVLEWGRRRRRRGGGERDRKAGGVRRTESPTTPMEYSSSASASGGDEGSGGSTLVDEAVVAAAQISPPLVQGDGCLQSTKLVVTGRRDPATALRISAAAKKIRRSGKRMTLSEMLDLEKSRVDDRNALQKEREGFLIKLEVLRAENQRLQSLKLQAGEALLAQSKAEHEHRTSFFQLPDLNEPVAADLTS